MGDSEMEYKELRDENSRLNQRIHDLENNEDMGRMIEQKPAQDNIKESEEKFRLAFMTGLDASYLATFEEGLILEVNNNFEKIFGYTRDEAIGKTFLQLGLYSNPVDRAMMISELKTKGYVRDLELQGRKKGGKIITYSLSVGVIFLNNKRHILGITRKIIENKKAETALFESQALTTSIINSTNDMIWSVDPEHFGLLTFNKGLRDYFLKSRGMRIEPGMRPEDLFLTQDLIQKWRGLYKRALEEGYFTTEYNVFTDNYTLLLTLNLVKLDGIIIGVSVFGKDITERKKAEEALLKSEARMVSAIEAAGLCLYEEEGDEQTSRRMNYLDIKTRELLGIPQAQDYRASKYWIEHIHPEDLQNIMLPEVRKFEDEGKNIISAEYRYLNDKRGLIWFRHAVYAVRRSEKGKVLRLIGAVTDITDRKNAEYSLKESQEQYRTLVDNANEAIVVAQDGLLKFLNRTTLNILKGYSEQELIDKPFTNLFHPDDRARILDNFWKRLHHEPLPPRNEYRIIMRDGIVRWADIGTASIYWKGQPAILNFITDITERKQAEKELAESEERFRTLSEKALTGIYIVQDGHLTYVNPTLEKIFGYQHGELIGASPLIVVHPDDKAFVAENLRLRITGEVPTAHYEFRGICKNGENKFIEFLNYNAELNGCPVSIGTLIDITQRKQADAKMVEIETLKRVNQAKTDLLSNVSHELRTPLAAIKGNLESLLETDINWTKEQQLDFVQSAYQATERLVMLISDLLDMSRIESGRLSLDKQSYPISEILDSVSGVLSVITTKYQLKIIQAPDLPPLLADKLRIGQVLTNLTENATKFSVEGSPILIKAILKDGNIVISVEDSGIGMTPEQVSHLFDRFYQAHKPISGKSRGTGLGLVICKGIVEAHGGQIWVESQPGKGSQFIVSIPVNNQ